MSEKNEDKNQEPTQYELDLEHAQQQMAYEEEEEIQDTGEEKGEEEQEPQTDEEEMSFEEEARQEGWVPLEEWKGRKDDWVDAETFVRRGREILPIVNSKLSRTEKELEELRKKFDRYEHASKEAMKRQQKKHMEELEDIRKQAFEDQDYEKFREVEQEMEDLKKDEKGEEDDIQQHPAVRDFLSKNPWYGQDEDLTAYADAISAKMELPNATPEERLEKLSERVKQAFPHKFEDKTKARRRVVEPGRPSQRKPKSKKPSYDDLPDEAKKACQEFVNEYGLMTEQEYVDSYFSQ